MGGEKSEDKVKREINNYKKYSEECRNFDLSNGIT